MLTIGPLNHLEFRHHELGENSRTEPKSFSTTVGIADAGFGAAAGRGRRGAGGRRGARGRRASRQAAAAGDGAEGFGVELLHDAILWSRRVRATRSRGDDARSLETCLSPSEYCYNQQNLETREDFIVQRLGLLALIVLTYFSSGRRRRLARRDSSWARRGGPFPSPAWAGGLGMNDPGRRRCDPAGWAECREGDGRSVGPDTLHPHPVARRTGDPALRPASRGRRSAGFLHTVGDPRGEAAVLLLHAKPVAGMR